MTPPATPATRDWWARPRVVLPLVAALLLLVVLLTPEPVAGGRSGDGRLSSHLSGALGARALRETASRFGWRVVMRDSLAVPAAPRGGTVHAVLAPPLRITPAQAHIYLEAVRAGDAMLFVIGERDPLSDSLGVRHAPFGGLLRTEVADSAGCGARGRDFMPTLWADGNAHLYGLRFVRGRDPDAVTFARVDDPANRRGDSEVETAAGFPLGRGRVVVVADPDQLRNDVLRRCRWGADVVAMRMLEWLRAGGDQPRNTLEFDEFHQGFGPMPSASGVVRRFLSGHPVGRAILQLALAALVLLLAVAPRPIPPVPRPRAERRDPLEQADALAHAYQQVGATRTATQRLLRGVRSRVEHAAGFARTRDDDAFLDAVATSDPARADDVALVRHALRTPAGGARLPDIGAALRRIEDSLTTTKSLNA